MPVDRAQITGTVYRCLANVLGFCPKSQEGEHLKLTIREGYKELIGPLISTRLRDLTVFVSSDQTLTFSSKIHISKNLIQKSILYYIYGNCMELQISGSFSHPV